MITPEDWPAQPVEVFESPVTGLLLPANAEIIIEGEMRPGNNAMEGPFGEFTGYYGRPEASTPIIDVKCVRYRNNPILTCALMADYPACEQSLFFSIVRSARIWADLQKLGIPGIQGVFSFPEAAGGFGATAVSIEQRYAGHAAQTAALTAQVPAGAYYTKYIIVVDEDVDPDRHSSSLMGDDHTLGPRHRHRYPALDLVHLPGSYQESSRGAPLRLQGFDQCL